MKLSPEAFMLRQVFHLPDVTQFRGSILNAENDAQRVEIVHQRVMLIEERRHVR